MNLFCCSDVPVAGTMQSQISFRATADRRLLSVSTYSQNCDGCLPARCRSTGPLNALPTSLQKRCDEWLALDRDSRTHNQAQQAIDAEDLDLLQDCMGQRLVFGARRAIQAVQCKAVPSKHARLQCRYSRLKGPHGFRF